VYRQRYASLLAASVALFAQALAAATSSNASLHDLVFRNGTIYDGSGQKPFVGDVAIDGDHIVYIGPHGDARGSSPAGGSIAGRTEIDVKGQAIAPGFINMLAHPEESLFADGRALSDLMQGVTLEVMGEDSMGPLNAEMKRLMVQRQLDIKFPVTWTTLGEYLDTLQRRGISPNVASFVGAPGVRTYVLGERNVDPTPQQLKQMQGLVHQAMEEGALGVTTALIYAPANFAKTPELIALAQESARCGGIYTAHMRSEGDRIEEALQETIDIAKASGAPAEIYHMKLAGKDNWGKLDRVVSMIETARASGIRISANMYTYTAGATGLDAAMPLWVQDGGLEAWIARLRDPAVRAKVVAEMRVAHPKDWENLYGAAGAQGVLLLQFKNPKLKPLTGKTLAEVARARGVSPEDAAVDLVIEDGSRVAVAYFLMTEDNIRKQVALPWVSFGSDEAGEAPEGVFLLSAAHPRAYGNFARVFAQYVRKDHVLTVEQAVHKLSALPAENLSIPDRGRLKVGYFADLVVFDPDTIQDHATYEKPHQLSTGVSYVVVNGQVAVKEGKATGAASGRVVRGRAWTGAPGGGGGCRASAHDWTWAAGK
jgi:N-acyl-D-amino-acid deacylase